MSNELQGMDRARYTFQILLNNVQRSSKKRTRITLKDRNLWFLSFFFDGGTKGRVPLSHYIFFLLFCFLSLCTYTNKSFQN